MKNLPMLSLILVIIVAIATGYLFYKDSAKDTYWTQRVNHYQGVSDSLRNEIDMIRSRVHKKDSMMLAYMSSLDKTLEELNKESSKNRQTLKENFSKQDSILSEYCRQMAGVGQTPDGCK
jgi:hypothetical protein